MNLLNLFMQFWILLYSERISLEVLVIFFCEMFFLLLLLKLLINLIFLLDKIHNFGDPRTIQYTMHRSIPEIPQQKCNSV